MDQSSTVPSRRGGGGGGILSCFGCCVRDDGTHLNEHVLQPLNLFNPSSIQVSVDQLVAKSRDARANTYRLMGTLHDFSLDEDASNLPSNVPKWPSTRQSFRVIHRARSKTLVLVSDGLSDPFHDLQEDANVNGYGLEFYIETPVADIGLDVAEIKTSWQYQLLFTVCSMAAGHGGIRQILDHMSLLSTEAEGVADSIPSELKQDIVNSQSRVGALLGLEDEQIPKTIDNMPLTDVKLVNIKLIKLPELALITDMGAEGRKKLASLFTGDSKLISSLRRDAVV